jgi:hypothetical protein
MLMQHTFFTIPVVHGMLKYHTLTIPVLRGMLMYHTLIVHVLHGMLKYHTLNIFCSPWYVKVSHFVTYHGEQE